jgi:hypothetical protein
VHIGENPGVVMRCYSNVMLIWSFFFFFLIFIFLFMYVKNTIMALLQGFNYIA